MFYCNGWNTQGCRGRNSEGSRHLSVVQCTEQSVPKSQVLLGDGGSFAMRLGDGGNKRCEQTLMKMPLVLFAEVEISELYWTVLSQNTPALPGFPGVCQSLMTGNKTVLGDEREVGSAVCKKPTEPSHWQNGKQANYCQGLGKLRIFYFLLLYPWFPATYIPSVHLVNVVFSFDVSALFFLMHWLSVSRWRCVWLFLRTWEKLFFPASWGKTSQSSLF